METKITFMESLLLFWFKGSITIGDNFVKMEDPNEVLGIIPVGKKKKNIPVTQISSVETNFKVRLWNLLLGLVLLALAVPSEGMESPVLYVIVMLLLAAAQITGAFQTILTVTLTSGEEIRTEFLIFEKAKAEKAAETINGMISARYDDTNVRIQTDRVVDAIEKKQ